MTTHGTSRSAAEHWCTYTRASAAFEANEVAILRSPTKTLSGSSVFGSAVSVIGVLSARTCECHPTWTSALSKSASHATNDSYQVATTNAATFAIKLG